MVLPQGLPWAFATFLTPSLLPCQLGASAFVEQAPRSGMATLTRNNGKKQSVNPNLRTPAEREAPAPGLSLPASPHRAVQRR